MFSSILKTKKKTSPQKNEALARLNFLSETDIGKNQNYEFSDSNPSLVYVQFFFRS